MVGGSILAAPLAAKAQPQVVEQASSQRVGHSIRGLKQCLLP